MGGTRMRRRGVGALAVRAALGAGLAGVAAGRAAPGAGAADYWCDSDPPLVVRTPGGRHVTVYCLTGVQGPAHAVAGLLGNLTLSYTAAAAGHRTRVEVTATVPCGPGGPYRTRLTVSDLPLGGGTVHGQTTGTCDKPMTVAFFLDVA